MFTLIAYSCRDDLVGLAVASTQSFLAQILSHSCGEKKFLYHCEIKSIHGCEIKSGQGRPGSRLIQWTYSKGVGHTVMGLIMRVHGFIIRMGL